MILRKIRRLGWINFSFNSKLSTENVVFPSLFEGLPTFFKTFFRTICILYVSKKYKDYNVLRYAQAFTFFWIHIVLNYIGKTFY